MILIIAVVGALVALAIIDPKHPVHVHFARWNGRRIDRIVSNEGSRVLVSHAEGVLFNFPVLSCDVERMGVYALSDRTE